MSKLQGVSWLKKKKKVMDSCPQGAELRFLSDRCFLKDKIMPEPLGRLADLVWAPTDFLELTALGATILNPLNQTSG